jgi:hypothetical protein
MVGNADDWLAGQKLMISAKELGIQLNGCGLSDKNCRR